MCGICGIVSPSGPPDPALVERMNDALVHRGPDDGSVDAFGRCVLGHRRLKIVDLETGYQPVANEAGDVVAIFNGELYNFPELRRDLEAKGHQIRGTGDTPVIPHLYEEHGLDFARRLSGMYAIALWDAARERLVLVRDRVGKKPLLWATLAGGSVAFASELKALLRLPELPRDVDPAALDAFLALGYVPGGSALGGVHKVRPAELVVFENGRAETRRYATLERLDPRPDDEWIALVRSRVRDAVRRRLIADVPLGALLSGGIDSSVVVAVMAELSTEPVKTFTVGFADAAYDEREHARAVAARFGTDHTEVVVEPDVADLLPRLAEAYDEPLADDAALPLLAVCQLARREVTVALTGDGGDESFGGYERYLAHRLAERVPAPLARAAAGALPRRERRSRLERAARFADAAAAPRRERYARLMEVFPRALRAELSAPGFADAAYSLPEPARDGIAALQALDVRTYLPDDLLLKADIASMAHSLELRSPLLDWEVLELGLSLPDRLKWRRGVGKVALRRAFGDLLPPQVARRGKKGFGVPLARWFRAELREPASDLLLDGARKRGQLRPQAVERLLRDHVEGRADHGHRLWALLVLELWQRTHLDAPAPVAAVAR